MRYVSMVLAIACFSLGVLGVNGQELTKQQNEPWSALERQVDLWLKRDWANHEPYMHPRAVILFDTLPSPVSAARMMHYIEAFSDGADEVVSHYLTPVTVTVVDDVAIINCYVRVLTRKDGELLESTYRLHNTWKKEDGRWLLLATCNATVEEGKPVK
jgi:ketosteroid isomerase-like protein